MKDKKMPPIPFWLQITGILMIGAFASLIIFLAAGFQGAGQTESLPKHTVTFAYLDGTIIETKEVEHGKGVFPPELDGEGIFRGWNVGFNAVTTDVEAHPEYYNGSEDNLFYFDAVYVQEGNEFSLGVSVGGHVGFSSGELTLRYDTDVLEFIEAEENVQCTVTEEQAGEIKIQMQSAESITEQALISKLVFRAKEKNAYCTQIDLSAANVKTVVGGQEIPADHATINNKVFFLQEVG